MVIRSLSDTGIVRRDREQNWSPLSNSTISMPDRGKWGKWAYTGKRKSQRGEYTVVSSAKNPKSVLYEWMIEKFPFSSGLTLICALLQVLAKDQT